MTLWFIKQTWEFHKVLIPEDEEDKFKLAYVLTKYNLSLLEYCRHLTSYIKSMLTYTYTTILMHKSEVCVCVYACVLVA